MVEKKDVRVGSTLHNGPLHWKGRVRVCRVYTPTKRNSLFFGNVGFGVWRACCFPLKPLVNLFERVSIPKGPPKPNNSYRRAPENPQNHQDTRPNCFLPIQKHGQHAFQQPRNWRSRNNGQTAVHKLMRRSNHSAYHTL